MISSKFEARTPEDSMGGNERRTDEGLAFSAADSRRLAEAFSSDHRKFLGRGPDWVGVVVDGWTIIVESRGVLTALEKTMAREPQNHGLVRLFRDKAYAIAVPFIRESLRQEYGLTLDGLRYCLDVANDAATLFLYIAPTEAASSEHTG